MITIREMQFDDLEQVVSIEQALFSAPWSETGFFTFLIREGTIFLVAEEEGRILGYCGVITVLDEGDITNVAVAKDRQGEGIGRRLVQELILCCDGVGVPTLHLEVRQSNARAKALYEHLGFRKAGVRKDYYESPVEDGILMTRYANVC